jgi:hypothetical protein
MATLSPKESGENTKASGGHSLGQNQGVKPAAREKELKQTK